jgi:hypothetical protein
MPSFLVHTQKIADTGAVTLYQRFSSALNLNIYLQMLFLNGVYSAGTKGTSAHFHRVNAPSSSEITQLAIAMRWCRRPGARYLPCKHLVTKVV